MYFHFSVSIKLIILLIFLFALTYILNIFNYVSATHTSIPKLNPISSIEIHHLNQKIKFDGWVSYYGQPIPNIFLDIVVSHNDSKNNYTSQVLDTIKSDIEGNFSFFLVFKNAGNYEIKIISRCWSAHKDICENNESIKLPLTITNRELSKNKIEYVDSVYLLNNTIRDLFIYTNKSQNQTYYSNVTKDIDLINYLSDTCYNVLLLEKFIPLLKSKFDINTISVKDNDNNTIKGSITNDFICSSSEDNIITSDNGNDIIIAGKGNDTIFSGLGNDTIFGMDGNDKVFGGVGYDILNGGLGNDNLQGESGYDILQDDQGTNTLDGGKGFDYCSKGNTNECEFILK